MKRPGLLLLLVACGGGGARPSAGADSTAPTPASEAAPAAAASATDRITVPAGFTITVFADSIGSARHLVVAPSGDVYVNTWRSPYDSSRKAPAGGFLVALRDTNRDGRADRVERFGPTSEARSHGGTGIALRGDALYAEADSTIIRFRLTKDALAPASKPETIVTGLTTKGSHPMHPIAVDGRGNLFIDMGSGTNACQTKDRQAGSTGENPCPELSQRAGIWRFSAERPGQRFTSSARYATGIRNAVGLAIHSDGTLYTTQHGRDQLAENWPRLFSWKQSADLPAEELLRVTRGADFGWPYCYFDPVQKKRVLGPEYSGDGRTVGRCARPATPVTTFPAHWAPNGLAFYTGTSFPERYRGGAFIAFHGSWNRAPEPQAGYNVVFQPLDGSGKPAGEYQVFADGFAGKTKQPGSATHRPSGVAIGPDGALYISDDERGTIWRVSYAGGN